MNEVLNHLNRWIIWLEKRHLGFLAYPLLALFFIALIGYAIEETFCGDERSALRERRASSKQP